MIKYTLLLFMIFLTSACEAGSNKNEAEKQLTDSEFLQQSKYMQKALEQTPFSALIKITSVKTIDMPDDDPSDDYAEQKLVYQAKVIETYRGRVSSELSYDMYIEKGESAEFIEEPFIITLCQSKDGFYWPGVGASFSADKRLIELAKKQARQLDKKQTSFNGCDD